MAGRLGLESPTIVAKMSDVLDSLVLVWASEDSLNEGLTIWQFPALAPADTDSVNESLRSWEGLLTGNTAMSLADVKEILRVGKVGAPRELATRLRAARALDGRHGSTFGSRPRCGRLVAQPCSTCPDQGSGF
jgi:hypothetical protein